MTIPLRLIYFLSSFPLLIGTLTFLYWFYMRTWFAENTKIEVFAFFTILGFLFFAATSFILSGILVVKNPAEWKKIIIPIAIIGLTVPVIDIYGTLHTSLSDHAFVRVINDSDKEITRIWSDHFEMTSFENKGNDFVINFYPVYTYDWTQEYSSYYNYEVSKLHIDLKQKDDSIVTYDLPVFTMGDCETILLTEIVKTKESTFNNPVSEKQKVNGLFGDHGIR